MARSAKSLLTLLRAKGIVTPVKVEFLAGARNSEELARFRLFLTSLPVVDEGRVLAQDWVCAEQLAARIPRDGKPRQMADCLIRAIADRLNCDVITSDRGFPR